MKHFFMLFFAVFLFTGCSTNSKNLTFASKQSKDFRITFGCNIPFDDIRLVRSFEDKNTSKDIYYVEFDKIYESYFEVTHTSNESADFSKEQYIEYLIEDKAKIFYQEKIDGILYLSFITHGKQLNQIVHAYGTHLSIVNAEPMMFNAIKSYCKNR